MNGLAPIGPEFGVIENAAGAFAAGLATWAAALGLMVVQKKWIPKSKAPFIASCELLAALAIYSFVFCSQKIFFGLPEIVSACVILALWMTGMGVFHGLYGGKRAFKQHTLFMLPFALPFLIVTTLADFLPETDSMAALVMIGFATIIGIMIFLPAVFQIIWRCAPLKESELHERLKRLCDKAGFEHAGMKTWTVMNDTHTAAIIGVIPRYRYVMFTKRILNHFKPEWLEAVLAHEIGHSKHKHLLLYPFIMLGMVLAASLGAGLIIEPLGNFFEEMSHSYPGIYWGELYFFASFAIFAVLMALLFRLHFGYFSRLFERQADLYIFHLGIDASYMAEALNEIGMLTGGTHKKPNWHHYSIQERIDFINKASTSPATIAAHNRKVRCSIWIYFVILTLLAIGLML